MTAPRRAPPTGRKRAPMPPLLTNNDLAGAEMAIALALAWHRDQPRSGFKTAEMKKLRALHDKLSVAVDCFNPFKHADDMPLDWGDEPIYGPLRTEPPKRRPR